MKKRLRKITVSRRDMEHMLKFFHHYFLSQSQYLCCDAYTLGRLFHQLDIKEVVNPGPVIDHLVELGLLQYKPATVDDKYVKEIQLTSKGICYFTEKRAKNIKTIRSVFWQILMLVFAALLGAMISRLLPS